MLPPSLLYVCNERYGGVINISAIYEKHIYCFQLIVGCNWHEVKYIVGQNTTKFIS